MTDAESNSSDNSSVSAEAGPIDILVLFGPANPYFKMIHYSALASLSVSIVISTYTLGYLVTTGRGSFSSWKIGESRFDCVCVYWRLCEHVCACACVCVCEHTNLLLRTQSGVGAPSAYFGHKYHIQVCNW